MPTVVRDLMSSPAVTCEAGTSLAGAARAMRDAGIGSVIVTERGKVAGILTERDLLRAAAAATTATGRDRRDVDDRQPRRARPRRGGRRRLDQPGAPPVPASAGGRRPRTRGRGVAARPHGRGAPAPRRRARDRDPRRARGCRGGGDRRRRRPRRGGLLPLPPVLGGRPRGDGDRSRTSGTCCSKESYPTATRSAASPSEVAACAACPPGWRRCCRSVAEQGSPFEVLRTAVSLLGAELGWRPTHDIGASRAACPDAAAVRGGADDHGRRLQPGCGPTAGGAEARPLERGELSVDGDGTEPAALHVRAVEQYQILTIDHGFNASTFTARVITSTGADLAAAVCGAIGALSGPLHGGAPSRALAMLDEIATADRAEEWLRAAVDAGRPGDGVRPPRLQDRRSPLAVPARRGPLARGAAGGSGRQVERTAVDVLADMKPGRRLFTNVEFYAGVVMYTCGHPPRDVHPDVRGGPGRSVGRRT